MLIIDNLYEEYDKDILEFDIGDVLIFDNGYDTFDSYLVTYDVNNEIYDLLSLDTSNINEHWQYLARMIEDLNNPSKNNNFKLVEVLKSNEVVLKRVSNE